MRLTQRDVRLIANAAPDEPTAIAIHTAGQELIVAETQIARGLKDLREWTDDVEHALVLGETITHHPGLLLNLLDAIGRRDALLGELDRRGLPLAGPNPECDHDCGDVIPTADALQGITACNTCAKAASYGTTPAGDPK